MCTLYVHAQNWNSIKNNPNYIYGEGKGSTVEEADKFALADLLSLISVNVSSGSSISNNRREVNGKVDKDLTEYNASVSSFSQATLTNTGREILSPDPEAHVVRWIERSEISKFYDGIENKVKEYTAAAYRAEESGKIDLALRNYYWALSLLKSHQRPNDITYNGEKDGRDHVLLTWIPEQMNDIFSKIKVSVIKREDYDVELYFTYDQKPVNSLDYTYFDGRSWSPIYSAKDGRGVLELSGAFSSDTYKLKMEYEFIGEASIDRDLACVMNIVEPPTMKNAYITIKDKAEDRKVVATNATATFSHRDVEDIVPPTPVNVSMDYNDIIKYVVNDIQTKNRNPKDELFTLFARDIYTRLINYGSAKIVGNPEYKFFKHGDDMVCRGLKMSFSFKNGVRKSFVEDVVFTINKERKISNISFGLGEVAENDILGNSYWSETSRIAIMDFLENYKTAFALKRADYLESIFDDDAVIVTATVTKRPAHKMDDNGNMSINGEKITYKQFDKNSYIEHLVRSFKSKEFINIRFADNEVMKLGKGGETYAIQISQEYYSSNYGDKGYLFLLVDVNDPDQPIIKIRTWQPEKDTNFKDRMQAGFLH